MPTLEADDALGIYATQYPGNVICSPDKDLRQIPGQLYDMSDLSTVTKDAGARVAPNSINGRRPDRWIQSGVPGIGIKRAVTLFEEKGYTWKAVVEAFKDKDLDEDIALENARLARILQCTDYDFQSEIPILWTPSPDYRVNS
jgi:hypothetical protein